MTGWIPTYAVATSPRTAVSVACTTSCPAGRDAAKRAKEASPSVCTTVLRIPSALAGWIRRASHVDRSLGSCSRNRCDLSALRGEREPARTHSPLPTCCCSMSHVPVRKKELDERIASNSNRANRQLQKEAPFIKAPVETVLAPQPASGHRPPCSTPVHIVHLLIRGERVIWVRGT